MHLFLYLVVIIKHDKMQFQATIKSPMNEVSLWDEEESGTVGGQALIKQVPWNKM
jgi:hypothetical protein